MNCEFHRYSYHSPPPLGQKRMAGVDWTSVFPFSQMSWALVIPQLSEQALRVGFVKKKIVVWHFSFSFQKVRFSSSARGIRRFFSCIHCENLISHKNIGPLSYGFPWVLTLQTSHHWSCGDLSVTVLVFQVICTQCPQLIKDRFNIRSWVSMTIKFIFLHCSWVNIL